MLKNKSIVQIGLISGILASTGLFAADAPMQLTKLEHSPRVVGLQELLMEQPLLLLGQ